MAIVAQLVPTAVPSNTNFGSTPAALYHVTITAAGGAGTYTFPHGMTYAPTFAFAVAQLAEGTTPTASNAVAAMCVVDFSTSLCAINLPGNGTYHVIYG